MSEQIKATPRRNGKNTRAVDEFNQRVPIGTSVRFWPGFREGDGRLSRTRSGAWLLGGHTPVVMVEDYVGGIGLTHVDILEPMREPENESGETDA